jgi:hypothetical protein
MNVLAYFNKGTEKIDYPNNIVMMDNLSKQKKTIYDFFIGIKDKDVTVIGLDCYALYSLNNLFLRYNVSDNIYSDDKIYLEFPSINPNNVKVYESQTDKIDVCIQTDEGLISKNYFNKLIESIMDDYYDGLNYLY